jgi:predicted nucleotidyltransferase
MSKVSDVPAKARSDIVGAVQAAVATTNLTDVVQILLIGSFATGEAALSPSVTDIDLLIVTLDRLTLSAEIDLKRHLRSSIFENSESTCTGYPLGIRVRCEQEMSNFSRYLALQGFHLRTAIPLLGKWSRDDWLAPSAWHSATLYEYAKLINESLWSDIRSMSLNYGADIAQAHAKGILTYLNCILVSKGVFLPKHSARVSNAISSGYVTKIGQDIAELAVAVKTGAATNARIAKDLKCALIQIRQEALDRLTVLPVHINDTTPVNEFWYDAPLNQAEKNAWHDAQTIAGLLAGCLPADARPHIPFASTSTLSLTGLREACIQGNDSIGHDCWLRINQFRLNSSSASARDWTAYA